MKRFGDFTLDLANQCLWHRGARIAMQPKPFALLCYLVENPNRLVTYGELLGKLWPETFVQPQVLRTCVLELRKTLGDDAAQPRYIQTLPKRGYCFLAEVSEGAGTAPGKLAPQARSIRSREHERELLLRRQLASFAAREPYSLSLGRRSILRRTRGGLYLRVLRARAGTRRSLLLHLRVRRKI